MSGAENPQLKAVRHFENAIDTKKPGNHRLIYNWTTSLIVQSPKIESGVFYQGSSNYINDRVRSFPYIDEADHFFRSEFKKNPFEIALSQYQTDGAWNHEEGSLKNLKPVIDAHGKDIESFISLAIEGFGKSGNIRGLTNLFYYAEEQNLSIPPHIQLEALFWAEVSLVKKFLEQEDGQKLKNAIRVSDVRKRDEDQKFIEKDPVLHLFRAYRLAELLEEISTG